MSPIVPRVLLALCMVLSISRNSDADGELGTQYCIAKKQTPESVLQIALNWVCGPDGGADCSKIEQGQDCFEPNTLVDHASYAFNDYYQKFKHQGGTCNFNNSGMIVKRDPSHGNCEFIYRCNSSGSTCKNEFWKLFCLNWFIVLLYYFAKN